MTPPFDPTQDPPSRTERVGALTFFSVGESGELYAPMRAWAVARPGSRADEVDAWDLVLDEPTPGTAALPLYDLKRWMLFGDKDARFLELPRIPGNKNTPHRRIRRTDAMVRYLQSVRERSPEPWRQAQINILIPAVGDASSRKRYLDTIREAFPDARVLPEPEMVVEYFRLVKRTLTLDKDRNNVILVIDIGASTSNLTIVISNRDDVVGGETGRQRAGRLQAIEGSCGDVAGHWVDEWIARNKLGINIDELKPAERRRVLADIEAAKIAVSQSGSPAAVSIGEGTEPHELDETDIHDAALEVTTRLDPVLREMAARLWRQLTGTDNALRLSAPIREERRVSGPQDALKLVDVILLAGGTSQLRGFKECLETDFPGPGPTVLDVGDGFPIAAAVGALAHVLREKYSPPRIRTKRRTEPPEEAPALEGALDVDIVFAVKPDPLPTGTRETHYRVLERGDPIVYHGGERDNVFTLDGAREDKFNARLIPRTKWKAFRAGLGPHPISLNRPSPSVSAKINTDRRLRLVSEGVRGLRAIHLDLNRFDTLVEDPPDFYSGEVPPGSIAFDAAEELVVDFGMSKTVTVSASSGLLDPSLLDLGAAARSALAGPVASPPAVESVPEFVAPTAAVTTDEVELTLLLEPKVEPEVEPVTSIADVEVTTAPYAPVDATPLERDDPPPEVVRPAEGEEAPSEDLDPDTGNTLTELNNFLRAAEARGLDVPAKDLLMTLLGLAVRPVVLLAGAPGSGKSTLARIVAHLLGHRRGETYHEVAVQADWRNDVALFGPEGQLRPLMEARDRRHLVLFDEINLTRPEYYLSRFFQAVEGPDAPPSPQLLIAQTLAIGTLNIDDTSRAPSPKVLDRCFLVEVDQVSHTHTPRPRGMRELHKLPTLSNLPRPQFGTQIHDELLPPMLEAFRTTVRTHGLREDLLPSRRVLGDIIAVLEIYESLGEEVTALMARDELLDRLIANRILVKLAGPVEQVEPAVRSFEDFIRPHAARFERTHRRLHLARLQVKLGFISPWQ